MLRTRELRAELEVTIKRESRGAGGEQDRDKKNQERGDGCLGH